MKMISLIQKIDVTILVFINNNMHSPFMHKTMVAITSLGNIGAIWIVIAVALIISKKYRNIGFMVILALILGSILGEGIIKHVVKRLRPSFNLQSINLMIANPASYSFPSGHTTSSFAAAGILSRYLKKYSLEIFSLAALIAFSRLYLYVHYPSDVLAGIILGLLCSKATLYIFSKTNIVFYKKGS